MSHHAQNAQNMHTENAQNMRRHIKTLCEISLEHISYDLLLGLFALVVVCL